MPLNIDVGSKAAKSGVRAARKSAYRAVHIGHNKARDVVDASERRAADSLTAAEKLAIGVVDVLAKRGRAYARDSRDRVYEAEARVFPRKRTSAAPAVLLALGAGFLLSQLFRREKVAPTRNAEG
jgi:hypothetical protein